MSVLDPTGGGRAIPDPRADSLLRRWLVAGTAGGVGTTTVTALLFAAARQRLASVPVLLDHTGGTLGPRLADGDQADAVDPRWTLHDLGPHAAGAALDELADPRSVLVLVSGANPAGCALAAEALDTLRTRTGDATAELDRVVLVLSGSFGRHRTPRETATLAATPGLRGLVTLPPDRALAAGGRVPLARLGARTRRGVDAVLDLLVHEPGR
ncbi:hypothetical protein FHX74_001240 [Friedmanniella endophytica]|uniref:MinD-like ATPase involved in chromosome partitioning or flagellar assembly n=1 Tax=Microlunatus kandeliicorticis TaxID=1759536 RepID=A0A7W3P592_9ACTN|nr:hypothetical protein [Microlunatus kandeliicorticis]MBA8793635.1 hypothetical protein [Microlunatus kandeliicorticis]